MRAREIKIEVENEDLGTEITHEVWKKNIPNMEKEKERDESVEIRLDTKPNLRIILPDSA